MTAHLGESWGLDRILDDLSEKPTEGYTKVYNRHTNSVEEIKLTRLNRLSLALTGEVEVGERTYPGWTGYLPFFVYTGSIYGNKIKFLDYRHGNGRLDCDIPKD